MTRKITVVEAATEEPEPITVGELRQGVFFQVAYDNLWRLRTDATTFTSVLLDGAGAGWLSTGQFLEQPVTRILERGESLTIGPDV